MLAGQFRYVEHGHRYYVGAQRVPGIRTVLRVGGVEREMPFLNERYQLRGKAVHDAAMRFDLFGVDTDLPDEWQPFYVAYKRFLEAVPCRWRMVETAKVNRKLSYASRVDRVGTVSSYPALVELKTGYEAAFHGPQLAGLDLLLGRPGSRRRMGVYLRKDSRFKVVEYSDSNDYVVFLDALKRYWEAYPNGE